MNDKNVRLSDSPSSQLAGLESALQVAADLCDEGICLVEPNGDVVFANQALLNWIEKRSDRAIHHCLWDWLPVGEAADVRDHLAHVSQGKVEEATLVCHLLADSGSQLPVELRFRRASAEPATIVAIIARHKALDETISSPTQPALRKDPLTGLPDRDELMSQLRAKLHRVPISKQRFAVLFIDVNEFKPVNDRFGHLVGDQVIQEVAQRLAGCVRSGDLLARFGGDEFVVLVNDVVGSGVRAVVNRIRAAFKPPFHLPGGETQLSVGVGVAEPSILYPSAEHLLQAADQAMYADKRRAD
jgi:diguanylate cyclase (GGDEF)-like protein